MLADYIVDKSKSPSLIWGLDYSGSHIEYKMMQNLKNQAVQNIGKLSRFFGTDMMYVAKGGFWVNANFFVVMIFGLITSILFGNLVSKETYGTYQFILAIAGTIAVFVPNNMSSAVLRSVAKGNEGDLIAATKFQIKWGIIGTIISLACSLWYVLHFNLELSLSLLVIAIFMPTSFALNTWSAFVQGKKDYKKYFIFSSIGTSISYGGVIAMIFINQDFFWLAFANIFFAFVANLFLFFLTVKKMKPNSKTSPETIPFGTHLSIMGIPTGITAQLDALLIFHFLGAAPLAVYSFATLLPEKLAGGLKFVSTIIFPKFSEKSERDVRGFFKTKIWWLLGFLSLITIAYAIFSPLIFQILFPAYDESVKFTQIYSLSFFAAAAGVANAALMSQKRTRDLYISNISTPFVKTTLLTVLMFAYGVWGVIWAQILTIVFQIIFPIYLLLRKPIDPASEQKNFSN